MSKSNTNKKNNRAILKSKIERELKRHKLRKEYKEKMLAANSFGEKERLEYLMRQEGLMQIKTDDHNN